MPAAGPLNTRAKQRRRRPATPPAARYYQSQARDVARRSVPRVSPRVVRTAPRVRAAPAPTPARTRARSIRAQGRYYQSQGRAVEQQNRAQKRRAKAQQPTARQLRQSRLAQRNYRSQAGYVRRQALIDDTIGRVLGPGVRYQPPGQVLHRRELEKAQRTIAPLVRGREYESQARDVAARSIPARKLAAEHLSKVQKPTRGLYNPKDVEKLAGFIDARGLAGGLEKFKTDKEIRDAASKARALKVLDQLMRPGYASAGGARALVKGQSVGKALKEAGKGARLKTRYLYSDVLKEAGVKNKTARGVLGFGLDVALDPTTYITLGTTSVGLKGATRAAIHASEKAARTEAAKLAPKIAAGEITKQQAKAQVKRVAGETQRKALARAERRGETGGPRGLTVSVAGGKHARKLARKVGATRSPTRTRVVEREAAKPGGGTYTQKRTTTETRAPLAPLTRATLLPRQTGQFLTRQTAEALRGTQRGARLADRIETTARGGRKLARGIGSELHGNVRPGDVSAKQFGEVKTLRREQRAEGESVARRVQARANAILDRLSDQERRMVIDAIEADDIGRLAPKLPKGAKRPTREERRSGKLGVETEGGAERLGVQNKRRVITAVRSRGTRKNPYRLFNIAEDLQGDLRHLNRLGRRSGLLAGRVGKQGRSQAEVSLSARATPVRAGASPKKQRSQQAAAGRVKQLRAERRREEARGFFPRTREEDIEKGGLLQRMAEGTEPEVPVARPSEPGGTKAGTAMQREHRKSRADLEQGTAKERAVAGALSDDIRETYSRYGTSVSRASSLRNLNTKLVQEQGQRVPPGMTEAGLAALHKSGKGVYRVRRGVLEKVTDYRQVNRAGQTSKTKVALAQRVGKLQSEQRDLLRRAKAAKNPEQAAKLTEAAAAKGRQATAVRESIGVGGGGQYRILDDALVREARHRTVPSDKRVVQTFDRAQAGFKSLALATPGYLVRNVLGDAFNAAVNENPFQLARAVITKKSPPRQAQAALRQLGKLEKSQARFEKALPKKLTTIKLTPQQAAALGTTKTEIPAMQAALLAEKLGVIRQGRFLELIEEGAKRPRGTHAWQNAVKRAEDSVRMTTFMGGLSRGLNPREAAANSTRIHFDYGDLTDIEKGTLRRLMPFYTFTSRNLPLQARSLATKPGRYAAVQKAREEGRKQADLPVGFEKGLNPYEARQLGLPFRVGGKVYTVSAAAPFTDLNDVVGLADVREGTETKRIGEMLTPFLKVRPELVHNFSLFYRDQIERKDEPLTRAPEWAVAAAKSVPGFAKLVGYTDDYLPAEGGKKGVPGWGRKADYFFRQSFPGPIQPLIEAAGIVPGVPELGVKEGKNARGMEKWQRLLAAAGPRAVEYEPNKARIEAIYDQKDKLQAKLDRMERTTHPTMKSPEGRAVRINREHPTPAYTKLADKLKALEGELDERLRVERPGGLVAGEEVPLNTKVATALRRTSTARTRTAVPRTSTARTRTARARTRTR